MTNPDDLHNEDGTHRSTAPSASGRAITNHARKLNAHTADGHTHMRATAEVDQGRVFIELGNYEFEVVIPQTIRPSRAAASETANLLRRLLSELHAENSHE